VINLFFVKSYDNIRLGYKSLIEKADNQAAIQKICSDLARSSGDMSFYREITLWAFYTIFISAVLALVMFIVGKSERISLTDKDWKQLRFFILVVFLAAFIFAYSGWILADDYYLNACIV
jgi:hypothetical protein